MLKKTKHKSGDEIVNGQNSLDGSENNNQNNTITGKITLDILSDQGTFSPRLTGVCLVPYPQGGNHALGISAEGIKRSKYFMNDSAVKLWYEPVPGGRADYLLDMYNRDIFHEDDFTPVGRTTLWEEYELFLKSIKPSAAYVLINHLPTIFKIDKEKAFYNSQTDNNLDIHSIPKARGKQAKLLLSRWQEISDDNSKLKINIWNEPQFETTGNWEPEDFARYAIDCSLEIQVATPGVVTVIPMHMGDMSWNDRMLSYISNTKVSNIEICNHNYGFSWIQATKQFPQLGTYLSRMGDIARSAEKLSADIKLVKKYGKGLWKFSILEWNLHPEGYLGSFRAANDLASVFYQFNFIKSMSDNDIDAATFFQLQGLTHFALAIDENLQLQNPPFRLFDWLGRYACGHTRINVDVSSPAFSFPRRVFRNENKDPNLFIGEYNIQYLSSMAFINDAELNIFVVNMHPESNMDIKVDIKNHNISNNECEVRTLTAELPTPMPEAIKGHVKITHAKIINGQVKYKFERHSLNVLRIKLK